MTQSTPQRPRDESDARDPRGAAGRGSGGGGGAGELSAPARILLDDAGIQRSLVRIAHEMIERTTEPGRLYLVAIPNGGVPLARRLHRALRELADLAVPLGVLDTTLYRDDLISSGRRPPLRRTEMPSSVDGHVVVLVDDVVKTGRTIRAAMDALKDFGRPRAIQVVGLIDRGHRELPIKLDYVGKNVPTHPGEEIHLREVQGSEGVLEIVVAGEPGGSGGGGGA